MNKLILASTLFAAAACGGKSTAKQTGPEQTVDAGPPVYAKLFEQGASWKFAVHTEDSEMDDMGEPVTNKNDGESICTVDRVDEMDGIKLAQIVCDDGWPSNGGGDLMSGTWASNAQGVWHLGDWPAMKPELDPKQMILAASPVADQRVEENEEEGSSSSWTTSKKGEAWCYEETWAMGDDGWTSICFDAMGPSEGSFGWGGGSVHDAKFTRWE